MDAMVRVCPGLSALDKGWLVLSHWHLDQQVLCMALRPLKSGLGDLMPLGGVS